jgi:hypothetical protein
MFYIGEYVSRIKRLPSPYIFFYWRVRITYQTLTFPLNMFYIGEYVSRIKRLPSPYIFLLESTYHVSNAYLPVKYVLYWRVRITYQTLAIPIYVLYWRVRITYQTLAIPIYIFIGEYVSRIKRLPSPIYNLIGECVSRIKRLPSPHFSTKRTHFSS